MEYISVSTHKAAPYDDTGRFVTQFSLDASNNPYQPHETNKHRSHYPLTKCLYNVDLYTLHNNDDSVPYLPPAVDSSGLISLASRTLLSPYIFKMFNLKPLQPLYVSISHCSPPSSFNMYSSQLIFLSRAAFHPLQLPSLSVNDAPTSTKSSITCNPPSMDTKNPFTASNLIHQTPAIVLPPSRCTCSLLPKSSSSPDTNTENISQTNNIMSATGRYTPTRDTKIESTSVSSPFQFGFVPSLCPYCSLGSQTPYQLSQFYTHHYIPSLNPYILPPLSQGHSLSSYPIPSSHVYIRPIQQYSSAVRISVRISIIIPSYIEYNHTFNRDQNETTSSSSSSTPSSMSLSSYLSQQSNLSLLIPFTSPSYLKSLLIDTPTSNGSVAYLPLCHPQSKPILSSASLYNNPSSATTTTQSIKQYTGPVLVCQIVDTFPKNVVTCTTSTVIKLDCLDYIQTIISHQPQYKPFFTTLLKQQQVLYQQHQIQCDEQQQQHSSNSSSFSNNSSNNTSNILQYQQIILPILSLLPLPPALNDESMPVRAVVRALWLLVHSTFFMSSPHLVASPSSSQSSSISTQVSPAVKHLQEQVSPEDYQALSIDSPESSISSSIPATSSAPLPSIISNNLLVAAIRGILLYGPPGVGKTYSVARSIQLIAHSAQHFKYQSGCYYGLPIARQPLSLPSSSDSSSTAQLQSNTLYIPVIRLCSIDNGTLGDLQPGESVKKINSIFASCKNRYLSGSVMTSVISSINQQPDSPDPNTTTNNSPLFSGFAVSPPNPLFSTNMLYPLVPLSTLQCAIDNQNNSSFSDCDINNNIPINIRCFVISTVLLVDEIDSVCPRRDTEVGANISNSETISVTNAFLTAMDGFQNKTKKDKTSKQTPNNTSKITNTTTITNNDTENTTVSTSYHESINSNDDKMLIYTTQSDLFIRQYKISSYIVPTDDILLSDSPLFVIGTTNNPNNVDMAIKRSGRLDQMALVPPPSTQERLMLLKSLCKDIILDKNVNLELLSEICIGYVAADLSSLVRNAKIAALKEYIESHNTDLWSSDNNNNIDTSVLSIKVEHFVSALRNSGPASLRDNAYSTFQAKLSLLTSSDSASTAATKTTSDISTLFNTSLSRSQIDRIEQLKRIVGTFAHQVGGLYEPKARLLESVVWPIKYKNQVRLLGLKPPRGVLLYGPPGNGKTSLARAVCTSLNATFISLDMATVFDAYLGESERLIRETFNKARDNAPSIIFIDELDSIVSKRDMGDGTGGNNKSNDVQGRILSTLLNEMDGISGINDQNTYSIQSLHDNDSNKDKNVANQNNQNNKQQQQSNRQHNIVDNTRNDMVLVFGATNRLDMIDAALRRPGRFDHLIEIPNCDLETAYEVLCAHTVGRLRPKIYCNDIYPYIDLVSLSHRIYTILQSNGMGVSGANISNVITQAATYALKRYITYADMKKHNQSTTTAATTMQTSDSHTTVTSSSSTMWETTDDTINNILSDTYELTDYYDTDNQILTNDLTTTQQPKNLNIYIEQCDIDAYLQSIDTRKR